MEQHCHPSGNFPVSCYCCDDFRAFLVDHPEKTVLSCEMTLGTRYYKFEITCPKKRRKILPTPLKRFKTLPAGIKNVR